MCADLSSGIVFYDDIDCAIADLLVEFDLHLLIEINDILYACIFFKRKMQVDPYEIAAFMGIDGMKL